VNPCKKYAKEVSSSVLDGAIAIQPKYPLAISGLQLGAAASLTPNSLQDIKVATDM
jgi:hypothetical protein